MHAAPRRKRKAGFDGIVAGEIEGEELESGDVELRGNAIRLAGAGGLFCRDDAIGPKCPQIVRIVIVPHQIHLGSPFEHTVQVHDVCALLTAGVSVDEGGGTPANESAPYMGEVGRRMPLLDVGGLGVDAGDLAEFCAGHLEGPSGGVCRMKAEELVDGGDGLLRIVWREGGPVRMRGPAVDLPAALLIFGVAVGCRLSYVDTEPGEGVTVAVERLDARFALTARVPDLGIVDDAVGGERLACHAERKEEVEKTPRAVLAPHASAARCRGGCLLLHGSPFPSSLAVFAYRLPYSSAMAGCARSCA